jgi:hypothetical protein
MSSAPTVLTILESSRAQSFLSLLDRLVVLPTAQPLMLEQFLLDGEATPLILDDPDWMNAISQQ